MEQTVVAVFANRACARQAHDALIGEGIRQSRMRITLLAKSKHASAASSDDRNRDDQKTKGSLHYRKESLGRKISQALGFEWNDDPSDAVVFQGRRGVLTVAVRDDAEANLAAEIAEVFGANDICGRNTQSPRQWSIAYERRFLSRFITR